MSLLPVCYGYFSLEAAEMRAADAEHNKPVILCKWLRRTEKAHRSDSNVAARAVYRARDAAFRVVMRQEPFTPEVADLALSIECAPRITREEEIAKCLNRARELRTAYCAGLDESGSLLRRARIELEQARWIRCS